ncbi:MAG: hypothetical protein AB1599_04790 [Planctomycetota bacterium]
MWKGYKLKIVLDKKSNEIVIMGNKNGLEYLANCCTRIIGKTDPSGHMHFMEGFENLAPDSIPAVVCYSDNDDDYKIKSDK